MIPERTLLGLAKSTPGAIQTDVEKLDSTPSPALPRWEREPKLPFSLGTGNVPLPTGEGVFGLLASV
jgi:hypothetical protein